MPWKRLIVLWLCAVAALLPAHAGSPADAFSQYDGFQQQDGAWRLEYTLERTLPADELEIGLVAEGSPGEDLEPPWGWVQYTRFEEELVVTRLEMELGGHTHTYVNLDTTQEEDQVYTTWSLGAASRPMLEQLKDAQWMRVNVYWQGGSSSFEFMGPHLAGFRAFATAILEADYLGAVKPDVLSLADHLFHGPTVERPPALIGEIWQQQLELLPGYSIDADSGVWRYEGIVYEEAAQSVFSMGAVLQGEQQGDDYAPWMYAELIWDGKPLQPYQVALLVDGTAFTYQRVDQHDDFVVWSLGTYGERLVDRLMGADRLEAKVYHALGVNSYVFDGSGLQPLRAWARTMDALRVFSAFDVSTLMQMDIEYIASVKDRAAE